MGDFEASWPTEKQSLVLSLGTLTLESLPDAANPPMMEDVVLVEVAASVFTEAEVETEARADAADG